MHTYAQDTYMSMQIPYIYPIYMNNKHFHMDMCMYLYAFVYIIIYIYICMDLPLAPAVYV